MSTRTVTSQVELDQALADKVAWIDIRSERGVWLGLPTSDSSTVHAFDSSTVRAFDSSTVHAFGSSTVHAFGSSTVHASDSSTVHASGSSTVHASDSSTVHASGSSTVHASAHTAVHLHSARVTLAGGVVIDHTKVNQTDPQTWCDYHGVKVEGGIATLYKAVNDQWTTKYGTDYSPGTTPSAPDWRDTDECGHGLHFGPTPHHALAYHDEATRFLAVGVNLAELRPITSLDTAKAKAKRVVVPCVEVDELGREVSR